MNKKGSGQTLENGSPGFRRSSEVSSAESPQELDACAGNNSSISSRDLNEQVGWPWALNVIATLAVLHALYFARAVLMPVTAAIIVAILFRPVIRRFRRHRIPEAASAAFVLLAVLVGVAGGLTYFVGPAQHWLDNADNHLYAAGEKLNVIREQVDEISDASNKVKELVEGKTTEQIPDVDPFPFAADTEPGTNIDQADRQPRDRIVTEPAETESSVRDSDNSPVTSPSREEPIQVEVTQPRLVAGFEILSSTGSVLASLIVTFVLSYFLLASGDLLINNVLRILPSWKEKRSTVELVHKVQGDISSYLLTVTCINVALGVVVAITMWLMGVPNPLLWGAMATLLNFVPILGAMVGVGIISIIAVLSFESLAYAALVPLVYWALTALEGNIITPHLLGRSMSLNPIMVFLALTFWGWMWGVTGAVLAVPLLAGVKVGCDHFERTRSIGTLLGGNAR